MLEVDADETPQTAIERAEPGETVVFTGEYKLEETLTVSTDGLTVQNLRVFLEDGTDDDVVEIVSDEVTLTDFYIDGNRENQPGDRQSNGIRVTDASNVAVMNGYIRCPSRHGVLIWDECWDDGDHTYDDETEASTTDITVRDIRVDEPRRDGCSVEGGHVSGVLVDNIRTFESSDRGCVEVTDGVSNVLVKNCHAEKCCYVVANQDHGHAATFNVQIINNFALECDSLIDSQHTLRHKNIDVLGNVGVRLQGKGLGGNGGIHVNNVKNLRLSNNRINNINDIGIAIRDCDDLFIDGNTVSKTDRSGILISESGRIGVNGNYVRDAGGHGIACRAKDGGTSVVKVGNNICVDINKTGIIAGGTVKSCMINDNISEGIEKETGGYVTCSGNIDVTDSEET